MSDSVDKTIARVVTNTVFTCLSNFYVVGLSVDRFEKIS